MAIKDTLSGDGADHDEISPGTEQEFSPKFTEEQRAALVAKGFVIIEIGEISAAGLREQGKVWGRPRENDDLLSAPGEVAVLLPPFRAGEALSEVGSLQALVEAAAVERGVSEIPGVVAFSPSLPEAIAIVMATGNKTLSLPVESTFEERIYTTGFRRRDTIVTKSVTIMEPHHLLTRTPDKEGFATVSLTKDGYGINSIIPGQRTSLQAAMLVVRPVPVPR